MTPDGSEQRIISTPLRTYDPGIDWSPDGKWIVVRPNNAPALDLINVESGLTLPLAFTRGELDLPAWRPRSGGSE
jgi:Tol biopolymer transport system component